MLKFLLIVREEKFNGRKDEWRGERERERDRERKIPAIRQFLSHILQVCVAHVVDAEDEAMLVLRDAFSDILE